MDTNENKSGFQAVMLYDGDCGFCAHYVEKWKKKTGNTIIYEPYQQSLSKFPQLTEKECKEAIQLILPEGKVFSGAHAIFKALDFAGKSGMLHWFYDYMPLFGRISEFIYQWIAHHRLFISRLFFKSVKKCG